MILAGFHSATNSFLLHLISMYHMGTSLWDLSCSASNVISVFFLLVFRIVNMGDIVKTARSTEGWCFGSDFRQ